MYTRGGGVGMRLRAIIPERPWFHWGKDYMKRNGSESFSQREIRELELKLEVWFHK